MPQFMTRRIVQLAKRQLTGLIHGIQPLAKSVRRNASFQSYHQLSEQEKLLDSAKIIEKSGFFDRDWYLSQYPDVASARIDSVIHYLQFGATEGRRPSLLFDGEWYLIQYPDVAAAGINPLVHFLQYGQKEGRFPKPPASNGYNSTASTPAIEGQAKPRQIDLQKVSYPQKKIKKSSTAQPILFVSHDAAPAGSQLLLLEIVKYFAQTQEFEPYILLCQGGALENEFQQLAKTWNLQQLVNSGLEHQAAIKLVLDQISHHPHAMTFCNTVVTADIAKLCRQANIPVLGYIHELPTSIESYVGGAKFLEFANNARLIVVVSDFVRQALSKAYPIDSSRLVSIHAGVKSPLQEFTDKPKVRDRVIQELELPRNTVLILGCGSIHPRKGTDLFVQLAKKVYASPGTGHVRFIWIGGDQEGPTFRRWCEHDIHTSGMAGKVLLIGSRPASLVQQYFAAADIFTLTSREDPFPLVNLEAMAHGLPIVAFENAGGAPEALMPDAGFVVPYLDIATMAQKVVSLINSEKIRESVGTAAREKYNNQYQWSRYTCDLATLIKENFSNVEMNSKPDEIAT
jgi:glycosyltransferase involved in cell wall biosynthesis